MVRTSEENIGTEAEGTVGHYAESTLGVQKWAVGREATVKKNSQGVRMSTSKGNYCDNLYV